jgi:VPDSG-CTERM motif
MSECLTEPTLIDKPLIISRFRYLFLSIKGEVTDCLTLYLDLGVHARAGGSKTHPVNAWWLAVNLTSTKSRRNLGWRLLVQKVEQKSKTNTTRMKKLLLATLSAGALLLCHSASGIAINVLGAGDFAARDIAGITGNTGLGDANVLAWLQAEAALHQFPAATTAQSDYTGGAIAAGDYLVLHYGSGKGGTPAGGLVALYFDADQASFEVPALGSGPNGFGGISFARLFDHDGGEDGGEEVPDAGGTLALLGIGIALLGLARRKVSVH